MNPLDNGGHKLTSIRLSKWIEGVGLVLREQFVPLLQKLIQIVSHIIIGGGQLVREGESYRVCVSDV